MDPRIWQGPSRSSDAGGGFRASVWIAGLVAALAAVTGAAGLFLVLVPPSYRAEAQVLIGARTFGLVGLRAHVVASDREALALTQTKSQAQLVASRDLARRAIEELGIDSRPEFDSGSRGLSPASHLLVLMGLKRDPGRMSRPERILQAYEDRLSVSAEPRSRLITIAFESQDRDLAAEAANRIADLFLEMRRETKERSLGVPEARIVSRAVSPDRPIVPVAAWAMVLGLSAGVATAVGGLVARQRLGSRRKAVPEEQPVERPLSLGRTGRLERQDTNGRQSATPRIDEISRRGTHETLLTVPAAVQHILSAPHGTSGTRILVTSCAEHSETVRLTLELCRRLGQDMRAILIALDDRQRSQIAQGSALDAVRVGPRPRRNARRIEDLVEGRLSFADVIRRDPSSRLHYVDAEWDEPIDIAASASVFEALAETYDFVLLAAPPLDRDNAAITLCSAADLVVIVAPAEPIAMASRHAETAFLDHGAREVLIVAASPALRRNVAMSLGRDAA